jgi:capsular polysaccharide biosynthesis protein
VRPENFLSALRPWVWLLVLVAALGGVLGARFASTRPPVYEAQSSVLVGPVMGEVDALRAASQATPTYAELAVSTPALASVATTIGVPVETLSSSVTATPNSETRLVSVRARSDSPQRATDIANAVAAQLVTVSPDGTSPPVGQTRVVAPASDNPERIPGYPMLYAALAAFCALVAAAVVVLLLERTRKTLRSDDDLRAVTDLPVLAHLPATGRSLPARDTPGSRAAATYRLLAAHLAYPRGGRDGRVVAVAGVLGRDPAGLVAANVAVALCGTGARVLVADIDGSGHVYAALNAERGALLSGLLLVPSADGVRVRSLHTAGHPPAVDGLSAASIHLDALRQAADFVVVTTGALASSTSALSWVAACDQVLLVVHAGRADAHRLVAAAQAVRLTEPEMVGLVVSDQRAPRRAPRHSPGASAVGSPSEPRPAAHAPGTAAASQHPGPYAVPGYNPSARDLEPARAGDDPAGTPGPPGGQT